MTKHKGRWTKEQEEALWAGVKKYGAGKWKVILSDPQFGPALSNRSNIDLKVYFISPCYQSILFILSYFNCLLAGEFMHTLAVTILQSNRDFPFSKPTLIS